MNKESIKKLKQLIKSVLRKIDLFIFGTWKIITLDDPRITIVSKKIIPYTENDFYLDGSPEIENSLKTDYLIRPKYEFIAKVSDAFIESKYGFIITKKNEIIPESLLKSDIDPLPMKGSVFFQKIFYKRLHFNKIISLRERGSENYCHFFEEFLPKYSLFKDSNKKNRYPIIISPQIVEQSFFKTALNWGIFEGNSLTIQKKSLVFANEIYFARALDNEKSCLETSLGLLPNKGCISNSLHKRLFVIRGKSYQFKRDLINKDEIIRISKKYGFIETDPGHMDLEEQIKLFNEADFLIGIHGAALTNMLFSRSNEVKFIEMFHPDRIDLTFNSWARMYNFEYRAIIGKKTEFEHLFYIDPIVFEEKLESLMNGNKIPRE